ncbi:HD domain-containing protein [Fictibacillus sp. KIGAM418]|uniref:HD domain-containing protein n=1 Tax=Fictibacillus marinisediminis TaxID=2878389 RepID=A0A9X1XFP9_9BACL|nr:HD domain-containing phosphohydrolase [Fictibacillus marinisediminis]MCK6258773.1 HD domain-containing protein [Fictibacillus marinisediminis]
MTISVGMELGEHIYSSRGVLLLKKGTVVNDHHIQLLSRHEIQKEEAAIRTEETSLNPKEEQTLLLSCYKNIDKNKALTNADIKMISETYLQLYKDSSLNILDINDQFQNEEYLYSHSLRVALIASTIGQMMGVNNNDQYLLPLMGLFHDVGKFLVDPAILYKPTFLTDAEFAEMKKHSLYGQELLNDTQLPKEVVTGALMHHERLDGSGYPFGLNSKNIPMLVRILSVADTFDAICSNRVYKSTQSIFYAIEELLKEANSNRLDIDIVRPFCFAVMDLLRGRKIELRNGKSANISHIFPANPNQPILCVEGYSPINLKSSGLTLFQVAKI